MTPCAERSGELWIEGLSLAEIADRFGTPCYVYSRAALAASFTEYRQAFGGRDHLVLYAVKANSNIAILRLYARMGSGFDIVSGGELARVLAAGGDPGRTVFSGVGKGEGEIRAALEAGILCFNVESEGELERLSRLAAATGREARVSLRVNPDVDPRTHPYIATGLKESKFGIAYEDALPLYRKARTLPGLLVTGIDCHIGSQLTEIDPFAAARDKVLALADRMRAEGFALEHIDLGGGLGIRYRDETPPSIAEYVSTLLASFGDRRERILIEPGRSMVGNAGVLLARVEHVKRSPGRTFLVVDAAMNDLMRPALYDAWHDILPVVPRAGEAIPVAQVVGPVCESGDFLGRDRAIAAHEGDLLAILSAGAYGMSMSSNYNSRPRAAEIIVDGGDAHIVRSRESIAELYAHERFLPG